MTGTTATRDITICDINRHIKYAREKRPWTAGMPNADKYRIAESELHEMAAAMLKNDRRGTVEEALDCIAVLVRIVEGE